MTPAVVRTLLEQQYELTDPMRSGNGGGDTGLRLMPHSPKCRLLAKDSIPPRFDPPRCTCHLRAFVELDRLMEHMHHDRTTPLLATPVGKVSLRALYWHLHQRYRRLEMTHKTVRYVAGTPTGVVQQPNNPLSKVYPLTSHQTVQVVDPGNWETELTKMRRKHSRNPVDIRVRVATWHPDVKPSMVELGVQWIAGHWALTALQPLEVAA